MTDGNGAETTTILKGDPFTMHMRVHIHEDVPARFLRFPLKISRRGNYRDEYHGGAGFLKGGKGRGRAGNSLFTEGEAAGRRLPLSPGVTGYKGDSFTVYHRLYDIMNLTVISDRDTVGYFDMESGCEGFADYRVRKARAKDD